jgi:hypothetical protein
LQGIKVYSTETALRLRIVAASPGAGGAGNARQCNAIHKMLGMQAYDVLNKWLLFSVD